MRSGGKKGEKRAKDFTVCTNMKIIRNVHWCAWCLSSVGFSDIVAGQSTLHLQSNFPVRFVSPGCQTSPVFGAVSTNCKGHETRTPWEKKCCYGKKINVSLSLFPFLYHLLLCYAFRCVECLDSLCYFVLCVFLCYDSTEVWLFSACIILFIKNSTIYKVIKHH